MPDAVAQRCDSVKKRILQVARVALAKSADVSLSSIAKRADVGTGALYQHFPTVRRLILAIHRLAVDRIARSVPDVLAAHASLDVLRCWITTLTDHVRTQNGLAGAMSAAAAGTLVSEKPACVITAVVVPRDGHRPSPAARAPSPFTFANNTRARSSGSAQKVVSDRKIRRKKLGATT